MQPCLLDHVAQPSTSNSATDQDFPALTKFDANMKSTSVHNSLLPSYEPAKVTEVIEIPSDQVKFTNEDSNAVGKRQDAQFKICSAIVKETGVEINLNHSKMNMVTVILTGTPNKVFQAKHRVMTELRQQETVKLHISHKYHGYLIGKRGERLRELQSSTMTRISIPPSNSPDPDTITITGPKQSVIEAEQIIKEAVNRQAQQGFERLDIPKIYLPFICGPNNRSIDDLRARTDTKINIPPRNIASTVISISGKRDEVTKATQEIKKIYDQAQTYKTIPVSVKKSQHHLVVGPRGSGLADILDKTGVSVELPTDPVSEELILRGQPENLGRALTMVYERAESSVTEELAAPARFRKLLLGKRGSALAELCDGYEKVNIEFDTNQDKIWVEGPPEEVAVITDRLKERIAELEATVAIATLRVDPKYFRHIIGRQGATILRLCENNVQIHLPTTGRVGENMATDEIVIEGDPNGVEKAKAEIQQIVLKLENEKCKDIIIEPRVQQLLCTGFRGAPPPMRLIYDTFPKVSVVWPQGAATTDWSEANLECNPSKSVVQLRGDRQQVDAAADRLHKLIKQVVEENFRQEIRIIKEFRPQIFGRGSTKMQKLLDETQTRIQYPNPSEDSDVFTLIGREENVHRAIGQLEELQKKLANIKEVIVSIPSALTSKFVGNNAPSLRSIRDQCDGVYMRFLNPRQKRDGRNNSQVEVMMLGPQDAIEKAQKLIQQLNSKVAELCAEELVHVDPKFHGFLIGRHGATIIRFREKHNVELLFPDRMETDPKLVQEIRIVGTKETVVKARVELESLIKSIEDEIELTVQIDPAYLRDLLAYRRTFPLVELERVRVIMPKSLTRAPMDDQSMGGAQHLNPTIADEDCSAVGIRLVGQKACVESAAQALQSLINDIRNQTTKEFPLSDPSQFFALDKSRPHFRDLERTHRVFINLRRTVWTQPHSVDQNGALLDSVELVPSNPSVPSGCLLITGPPNRIDLVYEEEIIPLLPIEEKFAVLKEFHRGLISMPPNTERERIRRAGASSRGGRQQQESTEQSQDITENASKAHQIRQRHGVHIQLPPLDVDADYIVLRGTPGQLAAAKAELTDWVTQCESIKADRIARSYEESITVPTRFLRSLIAIRPKLTAIHDVMMRFAPDVRPPPPPTATTVNRLTDSSELTNGGDGCLLEADAATADENTIAINGDGDLPEPVTTVFLRGYQEKVSSAKQELDQLVTKLKSHMTESLCIPAEVHSYMIGSRGFAIQKVMQEYNVRIEFPSRNSREVGDANTVLVTGDEADVDRACDFLIGRANDLMDRLDIDTRMPKSQQYREDLIPTVSNGHLRA